MPPDGGGRAYILSVLAVTPAVYEREKHPILAPPAAAAADRALHQMMQDTLRGSALQRVPFFDASKVPRLLDSLPSLTPAQRAPLDVGLMILLSVATLAERFAVG